LTGLGSRAWRLVAVLLAVAAALSVAACGGGDSDNESTTGDEKAADAEFVNAAIGRELTTIDLYNFGQPMLGAKAAPVGRQLRGQTQEHLNALTKAMRGLGGEVEAEKEELDLSEVEDETDFLVYAYEREVAELAYYEDLVTRLETTAPRRLATEIAASKAQHMVALRQLLGADLLGSFPEAFDSSEVPAPGTAAEE
jgi:ferritin-like protein